MPTIKDASGTILPEMAGAQANPTSTLTLSSLTTARSANTLIANSQTAGSVSVPSLSLPQGNTAGMIPRLRLSVNDPTSTAWGGVGVQVDLWSAPPSFNNGDGGAWSLASGAGVHLGAYTGTFSAVGGDGCYCELAPAVGTVSTLGLSSSTIYWTAQTTSASGVTAASKTLTLTAEVLQ